jgi:DNA-binding NtrC family response regulator
MNANSPAKLCLVEDDEIMGESLCDRFQLEGFAPDWHRSAESARRALGSQSYAVVISDIRLPDLGGDELFIRLRRELSALPPFIFITGFGSIDRAVQLLKLGAADYITKPFDLDQLVEKVRALAEARTSVVRPVETGTVLGISPAMRKIEAMLRRLAQHATTVLITGESGVGKERVALLLHLLGPDSGERPFVAVNCGAVTESLLEAELFGYEKGAFTGALRTRKGVFEQADGGTLFLDEIGDMPLVMQVKLLRAIQERSIVRVGGETPIPVALRVICATNRDLKKRVEEGAFREDLFYRINVIHLRIPPLRERKEDIIWFAQLFLQEFAREHPGERRTLHPATEQALLRYAWPGNLRELKHCIERACILSSEATLEPSALFDTTPESAGGAEAEGGTLNRYLQECERGYIQQALEQHQWRMAQTALHLGISRKNLWEKMRRLAIPNRSGEDGPP